MKMSGRAICSSSWGCASACWASHPRRKPIESRVTPSSDWHQHTQICRTLVISATARTKATAGVESGCCRRYSFNLALQRGPALWSPNPVPAAPSLEWRRRRAEPWLSAGRLCDRQLARRGRHGRGVSRARYAARSRRGHQGAAGRICRDTDRIARFEREAHALAALNHPNIAQIYGLEDAGGSRALVMELVEGPTLADRLRTARCRSTKRCDRPTDRRGARSRARAAHHPSRSEARQHQGSRRRHREGARLWSRQGA